MTFDEFREEWYDNNKEITVNTSGSTGNPKKIGLSKDFMKESARRTNQFFGIKKNSRLHSCVSADYIGGKMMFVRAEEAMALLTWETPSNRPLQQLGPKDKIDLLAVVPSQMQAILKNHETLPQIKNIIIGGSAIHKDLKNKIAASDLNAYETYGMTETASHIALRKISQLEEPFKVLPGIKVEIDTENCLKIRFRNGIELQTKDLAEIISDEEFYIKGRKDNVIISGGKKINPFDLEEKIGQIIESSFYMVGVPDEKWGEKLVLMIEDPYLSLEEDVIKGKLKAVLENWQIPKEIYCVANFQRTPNGKIIRKLPN